MKIELQIIVTYLVAIVILVVTCVVLTFVQNDHEKKYFEQLCEAFEQGDFKEAEECLGNIKNRSKYPEATEIEDSINYLKSARKKVSQINTAVWIKNEFQDYKHLYEDDDLDSETRDLLVEMYKWGGSGGWTVDEYEDFYREIDEYQVEDININNEHIQEECGYIKKMINQKKEEHLQILSERPPQKGMKEEEIQYTSWGKPNTIVRLEDSWLKWENMRMNRRNKVYTWYGKTWDGCLVPVKQVWTHYNSDGEGFVLSVHDGEDLINVG